MVFDGVSLFALCFFVLISKIEIYEHCQGSCVPSWQIRKTMGLKSNVVNSVCRLMIHLWEKKSIMSLDQTREKVNYGSRPNKEINY